MELGKNKSVALSVTKPLSITTMEFLTFTDHLALSRWAARQLTLTLQNKTDMLLCPATGSTPMKTYQLFSERGQKDPEGFRRFRIVALDEIVAPRSAEGATCTAYLKQQLLQPLGIGSDRFLGFRSYADPEKEVKRIREGLSTWGRIDLCLLGLGVNGHLGFVEPADHLIPNTHLVRLHPSSRQHSMFKNLPKAPVQGLTLGMADILQAERVILMVNGVHKKKAMRQLLEGRISTRFPASFLWLHPRAVCASDEEAMP